MDNRMWRICMFLIGCMGARFGLAFLAYKLPTTYLPYLGIGALTISLGFALIYINGWRKTGMETRGAKIWWNDLRPVHASLWFAFAILALAKNKNAWAVLFADALLGLIVFAIHHARELC